MAPSAPSTRTEGHERAAVHERTTRTNTPSIAKASVPEPRSPPGPAYVQPLSGSSRPAPIPI
eukprot:12810736-Alexandrium_andersonii.AAC.1